MSNYCTKVVATLTFAALVTGSLLVPRPAVALSYPDRSKELPFGSNTTAIVLGVAAVALVVVAVAASRADRPERKEPPAGTDSTKVSWSSTRQGSCAFAALEASKQPAGPSAANDCETRASSHATSRAGVRLVPLQYTLDLVGKQVVLGVSARF